MLRSWSARAGQRSRAVVITTAFTTFCHFVHRLPRVGPVAEIALFFGVEAFIDEPAKSSYVLANRRFRPLSHLSELS